MKNIFLSLLAWSMPFFLTAQNNALTQSIQTENENGIQWATGLSWEQVKQKAKQENKYIFLDCFTTWCGPCKLMDKQVYNSEQVGQLFNEKFISVKVQMDKTKADKEDVKNWYNDAEKIGKDYHVEGYPTFVFLSPNGDLVNRDLGFKDINSFINVANFALFSGKKFIDPYATYDSLIAEHKRGNRDYDKYPFMITMADKKGQPDLQKQFLKELTDYLASVEKGKRYTKERIEMWDQYTFGSNSRTFQWIYQDAKIIDALVLREFKKGNLNELLFNNNGWAETMVDKTIQSEIVAPFFSEQNKNPVITMSGMYLNDPTGKILKSDSSEADWTELKRRIEKKYSTSFAERNVRIAKVEWYNRHRNYPAYVASALNYLNKDYSLEHGNPFEVNNYAWDAFIYSNRSEVINGYINWMKRIITTKIKDNSALIDTYANLLYKAGLKKEAIEWEEKAMNLSGGIKSDAAQTVEKMKRGDPTWPTRK
jgi:thioredoxin-related protein